MKNLIYICSALVMFATSSTAYAQKDSIALQREARKLVRAGNALYNQNNYGYSSIVYKKSFRKK